MILRNVMKKNALGETVWAGVQLLKLAKSRRHHFAKAHVAQLIERGFAVVDDKTFTLKTIDGDMVFDLDHGPGCYCLHDGKKLDYEDDLPAGHADKGAAARAYVAKNFAGTASPDPSHPSGYKVKNYYGVTARPEIPDVHPNAGGFIRRMQAAKEV